MTEATIPRATYRLQFSRDFGFADAERIVPYLARLGISHIYCSPLLKARPGSTHGYDIVDHNAFNPEIGDRAGFERLAATLAAHDMGIVLDIVPNHMGVGPDNAWWMDVLEHGEASRYADFFDIDWRPLKAELRDRILLPVLGDHYGRVLESGELRLAFDSATGGFAAHYHDHRFPLDPRTYPMIFAQPVESRLDDVLAAARRLTERGAMPPGEVERRAQQGTAVKQSLAALAAGDDSIRGQIAMAVAAANTAPTERLHALLERQAWRLAYWRTAADEINYRRFFDVNELAGLRQENPQVFEATHALIVELVANGLVQGLRVDHPDGLNDPRDYLRRLVAALGGEIEGRAPIFLVVEKVLASYERLPDDWPVHGTTGYDFLNALNGLFVQAPAERVLTRLYERFVQGPHDFDREVEQCKKLVMRSALASELRVLAAALNRLSEADARTRDFTLHGLRDALTEVAACFPVYRTYVTADGATPDDRRYVEWAVAQARRRSLAADVSIFDFVQRMLLLDDVTQLPAKARREAIAFATRFQQYTAPLMAKGLEDTAFYRYHRLVSLNEVGGNPRRFGLSVAAFHHMNEERARSFPHALLASSTHDTKRSEDVRMRINVLSELLLEWKTRIARWNRLNRRRKRRLADGTRWPDREIEYLLYQTLVGAWPDEGLAPAGMPAFRARIETYLIKAAREAKVHTSWLNPDSDYEGALTDYVRALLPDDPQGPFLADFQPFAARVARLGALNSLSQTLLKLTCPGVPDFYQGTELIDLSLVDPDNRRPVDYAHRAALLDEVSDIGGERATALLASPEDGRAKLYLVSRLLAFRRAHAALFRDGRYVPLTLQGERADHVCAFARVLSEGGADRGCVVIAPRWFVRLMGPDDPFPPTGAWGDTRIEAPAFADEFENLLTGERVVVRMEGGGRWVAASALLGAFPVAMLGSASLAN
jgi:(1->4)-alpha-D-glucan 1-alpha-D-glucosylmutase